MTIVEIVKLMFRKIKQVDNKWFFRELPWWCKALTVYIRGDLIVLGPLILLIALTYFISVKVGLIVTGAYISVRNLGEMFYWFSHQFYERKYRPRDFGFRKLDNHALYILYQTFSLAGVMMGVLLLVYSLLLLK